MPPVQVDSSVLNAEPPSEQPNIGNDDIRNAEFTSCWEFVPIAAPSSERTFYLRVLNVISSFAGNYFS
jgi:hypothetical protein